MNTSYHWQGPHPNDPNRRSSMRHTLQIEALKGCARYPFQRAYKYAPFQCTYECVILSSACMSMRVYRAI